MRRMVLSITFATLGLTTYFLSGFSSAITDSALSAKQVEQDSFENYDIRLDKSHSARAALAEYRRNAGISDRTISRLVERLQQEVHDLELVEPLVQLELNGLNNSVELVSADLTTGKWVTSPTAERPEVVLRRYISEHAGLFHIDASKANQFVVSMTDKGRDRKLTVIELQQVIDSVPVFQGHVKAGFTSLNELVRVINNLAPGIGSGLITKDFDTPEAAVTAATKHIGRTVYSSNLRRISETEYKVCFERNVLSDTITAEKFYFPMEYGVFRPAWRVLLWQPTNAYYVIVDAVNGTLLWRKDITEGQTQLATYGVYGNTTSMMKTSDSPAPGSPGCFITPNCPQPAPIARTSFTIVGNEPPYAFNNNGWVNDGENRTIGNAAEAGIDRDGIQGIDPNGWAFGSPNRNFVYTYNPAPGIPPPGEEPLPVGPQPYPPSAFQQGSITQAFYTANRWHDELYRLGFNETARNFQTDNFGRGGLGNDSISVEVQDSSATNSSSFTVPADGARPRVQFTVWTGPAPDRDGALDNQMVVHELTHGLSIRLHGNATGLNSNMARGMGEGWSDFFALAMLSEPSDDPLGTYAIGCYAAFEVLDGFTSNCYYGIRRFPTARRWSVGSNGKSHDPLTFRYLNSDCNTLIGTTASDPTPTSAFPRGPIGSNTCDQIHNFGEVWASALWEVRAFLIDAHGPVEGNRRALQYVIDGMKLAPINPTILQERDAILIAAQVLNPADLIHLRRGFAVRGMGVDAAIVNPGTGTNNTSVIESFNVGAGPVPAADFDADGRTDVSVFRPGDGIWYLLLSNSGFTGANWGVATDQLVPADYDGDRKADLAVFRATADGSQPDFYILNSSNSTVSYHSWGGPGDIPMTGDYDADGKADLSIFRTSESRYWVRLSSNGALLLSRPLPGSIPVSGDFDGDGGTDFGVYEDGRWNYTLSSTGHQSGVIHFWGLATDKLVPADYDGDGKTDLAVFRPSDGIWYIKRSSGGESYIRFGLAGDLPVPGDYDGDTRADVAVYRDGIWYINRSSSGFTGLQFGLPGDRPLPKAYLPAN